MKTKLRVTTLNCRNYTGKFYLRCESQEGLGFEFRKDGTELTRVYCILSAKPYVLSPSEVLNALAALEADLEIPYLNAPRVNHVQAIIEELKALYM